MTSQATSRRLTVQEAADVLGTSVDAVRMRVRRGSLRSDKASDGRVYVWVDADASETRPGLNGQSEALMSEMRGRIQFLEAELQRKDAILLNMTEVMKAIAPPAEAPAEAPPEASESPTTATEQPGRVEPQPQVEGPQKSWWRRWFGASG